MYTYTSVPNSFGLGLKCTLGLGGTTGLPPFLASLNKDDFGVEVRGLFPSSSSAPFSINGERGVGGDGNEGD